MKSNFSILFVIVLLCSSCVREIERKDLYGTWDYVKVQNFNPPDSLSSTELEREKPAIVFYADSNLLINWGGKQLSHGTYKMDGKMIRYTESLEGGRKREFPFLIKELGEKELVFETMEQNYTRIKAKKR
jgi:hypothetical protein